MLELAAGDNGYPQPWEGCALDGGYGMMYDAWHFINGIYLNTALIYFAILFVAMYLMEQHQNKRVKQLTDLVDELADRVDRIEEGEPVLRWPMQNRAARLGN